MKKYTNSVIFAFFVLLMMAACGGNDRWTEAESALIMSRDDIAREESLVMRVLTVDNPDNSTILRRPCKEISPEMLRSDEYIRLSERMVATVTSPEQDGVGIAGPQVGINRRVVAVLRFDKEGTPFEVYPNIRITECRGEKVAGTEGCLSVPGRRGDVPRYQDIDIVYTSLDTMRDTTEHITGFTAVIFQHETDHLDGKLYTDYL